MSRVVAIHQPNFLPWLGYFDKLARADVFILLDSVQFPKKGGTWINRVQLLVNGAPSWATVPVVRSYSGTRSIREMRIDENTPWRERLLKTIQSAYGRAPRYEEVVGPLAELIGNRTDRLADYNVAAIRALAERLALGRTELVLASELEVDGAATDLLVELVRAVEGDSYLVGGGAEGYQEDERFEAAGLGLVRQDFEHPAYPQAADPFVPGLAVIDALMSCGFGGVAEILLGR
jgi:hypothetical protein